MSQWYPNQQQWVGGVPAQFNQPQQQGAGWPGQWQQQPTPPPPHQQQSGYYGPRPPQGGFPQQQFPTPHQFGPTPQQPMTPAQAFAVHQQQLQAMQQRQLAEQQRLAREEQRKREYEIQKRRLQHINVVKPAAANPVDDLFGKKLHSAPLSQTGVTPTVVSPTPSSSTSALPPPAPRSQLPPPPPSQLPPPSSQLPPVALSSAQPSSQVASSEQKGSAESSEKKEVQRGKPNPAATYQKLMADSLSNLNKPASSTRKKMQFKTSSTHLKSSQRAPKPVPQSVKSREWSADTSEFAGMFAVHTQQQEAQEDDGFGEFQSSVHHSGLLEQSEFQAPPLLQPQQPVGVQPPPQSLSGLGQGSYVPGQATINPPPGLSTVTLTSSYTHPIVATSVSGPISDTITSHGQTSIGETRGVGLQAHSGNSPPTNIETAPRPTVPSQPPPSVPTTLDSSRFPPVYQEVYKRCYIPGDPFLNTKLLFPILTSSQLPRDVLRDLWTLANKNVPGKLNQTEMFVLLGLIGLAQSGHPSPSVDALKHAPHPPIPRLTALPEFTSTTPGPPPPSENVQSADDDFGEFHGTAAPPPSSGPLPSNLPLPVPPLPQQQTAPILPQQPTGPPPPLQPTVPPLSQQPAGALPPLQPTGPPLAQQQTVPPKTAASAPVELPLPSVLKPSLDDSAQVRDKYSAFEELQGASLISVAPDPSLSHPGGATVNTAVIQPHKGGGGAVNELGQLDISQAGLGSLLSKEDAFQPFASGPPPPLSTTVDVPQPLLPSFSSVAITQPPEGTSSLPSDIDDFTAFADFTSASTAAITSVPVTYTSTVIGATSATSITSFGSSSRERPTDDSSWADFSQFSTLQLTDPLTNAALPSFMEFPPSEASGVPSSSTIATTVEAKPTLGDEEEKKPRSKSIGLEILEEELEGDITQPPPAPVDLSQPLVPETVSHVKGGDEFGEFEAYGGSQQTHTQTKGVEKPTAWKPPAKVNPVRVLKTCLTKCGEVLEQSAGVFGGVQESSLLQEICEVEEGRNKLRGIVEVYRLAKRVLCSLKHTDSDAVDPHQVESIHRHWKTLVNTLPNNIMEILYSQMAATKTEEDSDVLSDTISKCSLCLLPKDVTIPPSLSLDGREEEYHLPLLFHQGQSYHATCANFWCNAVLEELPLP